MFTNIKVSVMILLFWLFYEAFSNGRNSANGEFCFDGKNEGRRLDVPVLRTLYAPYGPTCVLHCLNHNCCRSVNYNKKCSSSESKYNCELLHYVASEQPGQMKHNENFDHLVVLQPTRTFNCSCVSCTDGWNRDKCQKFNWIKQVGNLMQIDNCLTTDVWGVNSSDYIFRLRENKTWEQTEGWLKHVSTGAAGIWGVNINNYAFIRKGVTPTTPSGTEWQELVGPPPKLEQIDSGPRGIVYAVDQFDYISCRQGITTDKPEGTAWIRTDGHLTYVSCNVLGCYGVNRNNTVFYRTGVTEDNCNGDRWILIPGLQLKQIEAGVSGDVYGIGVDNAVYRRIGINMMTPTGTAWKKIHDYASHITTGLNGMYMLVDGEIFHSRACEGTN